MISGDLTHNMEDKMKVAGAPWLPEYFGQETFSTIHRLVESPHEKGVLWAGSDDGRIHLTRNGGEDWVEITPPDLPELSAVYEIEISPHDPATAYVAITRYRKDDDYSPYLLGTKNYGQTWTRLDGSFPKGEITRTIREDTVRQGLLFVGTETGVFGSIDDGATWRRMNLNMPRVPVHDLKIKNADLIAATHGRGFLDHGQHQSAESVLAGSGQEDGPSLRSRDPLPLRLQLVDCLRRWAPVRQEVLLRA